MLVSGPAGTGKTVGCLWKIHALCEAYPGTRALITRKTRVSLVESALVTFEQMILGSDHPMLVGGPSRAGRHSYQYDNGSEVIVGGLDRPSRIMSTEYDLAYAQEAIELEEDDWETVSMRLRPRTESGRKRGLPFRQLIADTNPDRPTHWLHQRCLKGKTTLLQSWHRDNPAYHDGTTWTPAGQEYLDRLAASLTGHRRIRLLEGRWASAEGVVYPEWDPDLHLIEPFPIPADWPRLWSVDFGYTNPFVWQEWALDGDNRAYLVQEIYRTHRIVSDHAKDIIAATRGHPAPYAIICDHDAEDRATLSQALGLPTLAAIKAVKTGLDRVRARLRRAGDNRPRLFVFKGALTEPDHRLREAKLPCCLAEEMDGYVWDDRKAEHPAKANDHAADAMRYLVATLDHGEAS